VGERNLRLLYAGRALRSFSTAFLTVVFPLELAAEGHSAAAIGAVLTGGALLSAVLMVGVGLGGDRFGRRPMLVGLGVLGALGGLGLALSGNLAVAVLASGLGGVGRGGGAGSGGAWGPFFTAEQPILAGSVPAERRTAAFGALGFIGVLAGAAGSLVAFVPDLVHGAGWSLLAGYRVVFVLGAAVSAGAALVSLPLREPDRGPRPRDEGARAGSGSASAGQAAGQAGGPPGGQAVLSTRQLIGRLALTNSLNGFGIGFLGPLLTYWFHVRYGAGSGEIGALYTVVNLVTALPFLWSARIARRLGAVRTVVATRAASVAVLVLITAMPDFVLAGLLFSLRMALNSLGLPARQSYTMGVAAPQRRGTVAALGTLPSLATASVSPAVGGALMEVFLDAPLVGAALFMGANTVAYYLAFRRSPPPEEMGASTGPPAA
jgi:MFS family permease